MENFNDIFAGILIAEGKVLLRADYHRPYLDPYPEYPVAYPAV